MAMLVGLEFGGRRASGTSLLGYSLHQVVAVAG
jgi:hypothetical protein